MSEINISLDEAAPFAARLRYYRERAGLTRAVLGGLVGRSDQWVKGLESGRTLIPRLPMLLRLASVLNIDDLADLTGGQALPVATYTKASHEALPKVGDALTHYPIDPGNGEPASAADVATRTRQAWELWHGAKRQRSAVAVVLPGLLTDARISARLLDGTDRRDVLRSLAQIYHVTQLYLSFQPVPELVMLAGDRAMTAAQDADDPHAIAGASWYLNHVFRDSGERDEARIELAHRACALLKPERGGEDLARWGLLQLAVALSHAKSGREGDALHHWDEASRAAQGLGAGYTHPWLMFGQGTVDAYAITIQADLAHSGYATRAASRIDLATIPSATRRSFHLAETARAYLQRREQVSAVHLLQQAYDQSPETARFSVFARSAVLELSQIGMPSIRGDVSALAGHLGLKVA